MIVFKERTLRALADMVCGNVEAFSYRSSSVLTEFFQDCDTDYVHDGSTRWAWVAGVLREMLAGPLPGAHTGPPAFSTVIAQLMDPADAVEEGPGRPKALGMLNAAL